MKKFKGRAWVHPIEGGDDDAYNITINAETKKAANELVRKWLRKKSAVTEDFSIEEVKA